MDQYLDIAKEYYDKAVKAVSKTETEKKMANALSRHNWGASSTELREIARLTNDWTEYAVVMREIWTTMQLTGARWRQIFKSLTLLEYLIKNGADRVIQEATDKIYHIKTLQGFNHYDEGVDKGAGIREKAKELVELLGDKERIKEEREKAVALRDKYTGMGRDGTHSASAGSNGYDGGSYDSGGYGGRYSNSTSSNQMGNEKWDKGFSNQRKAYDNEDDDDDDFNPREEASSSSKAKNELAFDDDEEEEFSSSNSRNGGKKGKKGKLKIKIRSAAKTDRARSSSGGKSGGEDLLFGDMQSGTKDTGGDVDLFGEQAPTESNETFDPFGNSNAQGAAENDEDDWAGFESAKPPAAAQAEADLFGQVTSAQPQQASMGLAQPPSGQSNAFDAFASSTQPQSGGGGLDLLGTSSSMPAPSQSQAPMGGLDLLGASSTPTPTPAGGIPLNQQMLYSGGSGGFQQAAQPPQPQQAVQSGGSSNGDALWGSGLVDLGNLSLNSSKPSGPTSHSQQPAQAQQQVKAPMGQPMMQSFQQPMGAGSGMMPMQAMQPMAATGMNPNLTHPNRMATNMPGGFPQNNQQQSLANGNNQNNALDDLFGLERSRDYEM